MAIVGDILRELNHDEVNEIMELYKNKFGIKNFHYLLMYNQIKWNKQLNIKNINSDDLKWLGFRKTFYTHRDCDFRKYGTYVSLHFDLVQSVSFFSWETDNRELYDCLTQTKLIQWHQGPLLTNVEMHFCDKVKEIAASIGITVQRARKCLGLIMNNEKAKSLYVKNLPLGYVLNPLQVENAELMHEMWANKKEGSLEYIRGLISINKTLGITREEDNKLVGWIFQNDFSGLGILYVLQEVQRNGFGSILASALSKEIALTEPVELSAWIVNGNIKSEALLNKLGYENYVYNEWIQFNKFGCN